MLYLHVMKEKYPRESVEWAYCIFHQKMNVYLHSDIPSQKDDIENLVGEYAMEMNPGLYAYISGGKPSFLMEHDRFVADLRTAVEKLEKLMRDGSSS